MDFLLFILYYLICTLIFGVVGLFIYRFYIRKKCFDISRIAEKQIDDYFSAYDFPEEFTHLSDENYNKDENNP